MTPQYVRDVAHLLLEADEAAEDLREVPDHDDDQPDHDQGHHEAGPPAQQRRRGDHREY